MAKAQLAALSDPRPVVYPERDGNPMADNTLQFEWIVILKENLDDFLPDFVAGDLLWYPVEGDPKVRQAPDVLVALGRPKGRRGSYRQWVEGGIPPQVVFEVLSPGNTLPEMYRKLLFYDLHGVEEYYVYDPDARVLSAYHRADGRLSEVAFTGTLLSPRLGVRFHLTDDADLELYRPDGQRFRQFKEISAALEAEKARADAEKARADTSTARAEALAEKLRALGFDPDAP